MIKTCLFSAHLSAVYLGVGRSATGRGVWGGELEMYMPELRPQTPAPACYCEPQGIYITVYGAHEVSTVQHSGTTRQQLK